MDNTLPSLTRQPMHCGLDVDFSGPGEVFRVLVESLYCRKVRSLKLVCCVTCNGFKVTL